MIQELLAENQQLNSILSQASRERFYLDFHYLGNDITSDEEFVRVGFQAVKNKILFWLNLNSGDIIRSLETSPLLPLIGKRLSEENVIFYEKNIKKSFEKTFTDISLLQLKVVPNLAEKKWVITMVVLDTISSSVISLEVEVVV